MTALRYALTIALCLAAPAASAEELDSAVGKALFDRKWVQAPASTNAADGLGPLFNAMSCASCHKNGNGARFSTIDGVLGVAGFVVRLGDAQGAPDPVLGRQLQEHAIPGLQPEARIAPYLEPQGDGLTRMLAKVTFTGTEPAAGVQQEIRIAPSLLGRGMIARVDQSEIVRLADPDDRDGDGISGRVRIIETKEGSKVGRFGLKATAASLVEQTADAAMLDMGLSSPLRPYPYGDCTEAETACRANATGRSPDFDGEEISRAMVQMVADYVATFQPKKVPPNPEGERLLRETGCTSCHVPGLKATTGETLPVFTDLLLHDMGNGLAGGFPDGFATANEWRTAPLIDLAAQKGKRRFLHDGRAATLDEAIRWHSGEAVKAKERYLELPAEAKARLIDYLGSLEMPVAGRLVLCLVMLAMAGPARAADETLSRLVDRFIVPHYQALSLTADAQEKAWSEFCAKPDAMGFETLQRAYLATADSWSQIEFLRYGPIGEEFRAERLSYWPERKNATAKALGALLEKNGVEDLAPQLFVKNSVAVQGLPALERLLFDEKAQVEMLNGLRKERRCAVGQAIAWNIVMIAHDVRLGWTNDVVEAIANPDTAKEATSRIATDFLSAFAYMRDSKLRPVLGKDAAEARPALAEGWRSKRSKRALSLNIETALDIAKLIMAGKEGDAPATITTAASFAEALPEDFGPAVRDVKQRQQFYLLLDALAAARDKAHDEIPALLGVTVGFNSQDGD